MQFMALIYDSEDSSDLEWDVIIQQYEQFEEKLKAAGKEVHGNALQPVSTATSVRVRDGKKDVFDGPFAETKEQLGGYYILDCDDLDEALEWAAQIPGALTGTVEVRPVIVFDE